MSAHLHAQLYHQASGYLHSLYHLQTELLSMNPSPQNEPLPATRETTRWSRECCLSSVRMWALSKWNTPKAMKEIMEGVTRPGHGRGRWKFGVKLELETLSCRHCATMVGLLVATMPPQTLSMNH